MARIRSLKPEFWASEQVMELSPLARLAFIGMWSFCDDGGVHPASTKTLKAEIFPSDDLTTEIVSRLVDELTTQGLVVEFEVAGKRFWHVTGWAKHQRIDKPTYRYPQPDTGVLDDASSNGRRVVGKESVTPPRGLVESSTTERSGEEWRGGKPKPTSDEVGSAQASPDHLPACPHQEIIKLYGNHLPDLPQPRVWDGQREQNLRARWRWVLTAKEEQSGERYATDAATALSFFDRFFSYVAKSDFLTGRNCKWQSCNLAWLVKAENFAKVLEGQYENRQEAAA